MKTAVRNIGFITIVAILSMGCAACGLTRKSPSMAHNEATHQVVVQEVVRTAPGVVEYVWEEPMVDVIDVPPGLDPEGVYYRPAHQSIVEIRQGRWNYQKPRSQ